VSVATPRGRQRAQPSAWRRRLPAVALATLGLVIAGYLTLFQLGVLRDVAEPFFGDGSRRVLTSPLSRLLPVPDAALGAAAYAGEIVLGLIGSGQRWRTLPWIVLLFGGLVTVTGAVAIVLLAVQVGLVHALCTLCLASAATSLIIAALSLDEPLATLHLLRHERARGRSLWRLVWHGIPDR
jgi:uncharacterized membrane protein